MVRKTYGTAQAEALLPLLRAIGREVKERTLAIEYLEDQLSLSRASPRGTAPAGQADELLGRLAVQKRELRAAQRELEHLGCRLDKDHPLRILIPGDVGPMAYEGSLARTTFRFHAHRLGA